MAVYLCFIFSYWSLYLFYGGEETRRQHALCFHERGRRGRVGEGLTSLQTTFILLEWPMVGVSISWVK